MAENKEFWEKSKSLECFSTEDKGSEYHENHVYTRCNGGIRSVKKQSNEIVGRADCEEDPVLCSKIDKGIRSLQALQPKYNIKIHQYIYFSFFFRK